MSLGRPCTLCLSVSSILPCHYWSRHLSALSLRTFELQCLTCWCLSTPKPNPAQPLVVLPFHSNLVHSHLSPPIIIPSTIVYQLGCDSHFLSNFCINLSGLPCISPPGSSVHGIFQARILEWVAISFSRGSSQGSNPGLPHCRLILYCLSHYGSPH